MDNSQKIVSLEDRQAALGHYNRGKELWAQGKHGQAMSAYNEAIALDPNSPAVQALRMANEIMDFYNHDLYNP